MIGEGNHRTIWNKTFELVTCDNCGKPFATQEQLNYVYEKSGCDLAAKLCEMCRRKELATKLGQFSV
jgi:hypothetical protein